MPNFLDPTPPGGMAPVTEGPDAPTGWVCAIIIQTATVLVFVCGEGGGGIRGTPTYIPQNDRRDALIILRYIWRNFSKKIFVRATLRPHF